MDSEKRLYTVIVHTEHRAGMLSLVTAVFTRRMLSIESINASFSSIPGLHKYTMTTITDRETIEKVTAQIRKKIDVVNAQYYTDDEVYQLEIALYKVQTSIIEATPEISSLIRKAGARIVEVNPVYCVVEMHGKSEEISRLSDELRPFDCVIQFVRSGRVVITKDKNERTSEFLENHEALRRKRMAETAQN